MTPVVLDHGRFELRVPALRADRASGQALLVVVLGIALTAILLSRPSADAGAGNGGSAATPAVIVSPSTSGTRSPTDTPSEEPTAAPSSHEASPPPSTAPSVAASAEATPIPSAAPPTSGATYKVKSGDTLVAIAARFETTVAVLAELNGITDPSRLRVGQILMLP